MAERTIRSGIGSYLSADGLQSHGMLGDVVDVHEDDLERFDRLNPEEPAALVADDTAASEGAATEDPYDGVKVADLKAEIEKRNADRADDAKIVVAEPGHRAELVAALVADDTAAS